jgi:hypothetical protein
MVIADEFIHRDVGTDIEKPFFKLPPLNVRILTTSQKISIFKWGFHPQGSLL